MTPDFGARSLAMAGIGATLEGSDAVFNNFANSVSNDGLFLLANTQRRFSLSELTSASFGIQSSIQRFGHIGFAFSNYGFEEYSEQKISVLYARQLHKLISISANFDFNSIRVSEYGSGSALSFGIGIAGKISEALKYGIYIFNPEKIEIAENTEILSSLRIGFSYIISQKVSSFVEMEKIVDEELNIIVGMEYLMADKVFLRVGANTNPGSVSFGLGYYLSNSLAFDGAVNYNTLLGLTPGLSLRYMKPKSNK